MILEGREACSRYLFYGIRYETMIHFRDESYMGGFLASLAAEYRQFIGIRNQIVYVVE